jgi:methyl-accepting chemotaxis protein
MSMTSLFVNMSLRNKITAAFVVVLLLVGVLGFAAVDRLTNLSRTVDTLASDSLIGISELGDLREALLRYRLAIARYLAGRELSPGFDASAGSALARYREHETKYATTVQEPEEQTLYNEMRRAMQDYLDSTAPAVSLYHAGKPQEAWDLYLANGGVTKGEALDVALDRAKRFNAEEANRLTAQADADYASGLWMVGGLLTAAPWPARPMYSRNWHGATTISFCARPTVATKLAISPVP